MEKTINDVYGLLEKVVLKLDEHDKQFERIDARFEQIDSRFIQIDSRFEQIESKFEQIDSRFEQIEKQLSYHGRRLNSIEEMGARLITMAADNHAGLHEVNRRLDRIEVDLSELKVISDSNRSHTSFLDKKVWGNEKELFLLRERVEQLHVNREKEAEED
ncbi:MAG TPA: hypothetical protein VE710_01845 [Candidatus Bathyarchaeia archaeon]|nr:hypothetical protein [Candidatus Bathyarchaeia archaeon]